MTKIELAETIVQSILISALLYHLAQNIYYIISEYSIKIGTKIRKKYKERKEKND